MIQKTSEKRIQATLQQDGTILLEHLPFVAGQSVEIIVRAKAQGMSDSAHEPLRGSVLRYDSPFEQALPPE